MLGKFERYLVVSDLSQLVSEWLGPDYFWLPLRRTYPLVVAAKLWLG